MSPVRPASALVIVLCLAATACTGVPEYPPPEQYTGTPGFQPAMLQMGRRNGGVQVLRDILDSPGLRRWTFAHPAFSFRLSSLEDLDFRMRFVVHETTFATTGPVTLTIHINGEIIDRPRFDTSGEREYRHAVPARLLALKNPVVVEIDVDPVWVSPADHAKLGIVLVSIGFEERAA